MRPGTCWKRVGRTVRGRMCMGTFRSGRLFCSHVCVLCRSRCMRQKTLGALGTGLARFVNESAPGSNRTSREQHNQGTTASGNSTCKEQPQQGIGPAGNRPGWGRSQLIRHGSSMAQGYFGRQQARQGHGSSMAQGYIKEWAKVAIYIHIYCYTHIFQNIHSNLILLFLFLCVA